MSDEYISYLQSMRRYLLNEGYECAREIKFLEVEIREIDFELSELKK